MTKQIKKLELKNKNSVLNIFGIIAISIVIIFAIFLFKEINNLYPNKYLNTKKNNVYTKKEGEKETKKQIETLNFLLVGRGGFGNDAPDLTDTIILAKLNTKNKTVSLLSIPRDLYVKYPTNGRGKINSIYSTYFYREKDKDLAMKMLEQKITEITGEKIDYYVNVDFRGFKKIVDAIGGIEIDIKKELVDTKYPNNNWGYQTVIFRKGLQNLNGERALQYARSRKSTSDYDRSIRQQQILKAVKDKIKNDFLLQTPKEITEIYNIFKDNVFTNANLKDVISIILITKVFEGDYSFVSSNINDTCYPGSPICQKGGIVYTPAIALFGASVELFNGTSANNLSDYKLPRKYADIVLNYPKIGKENYKINIFNSTKRNGLAYNLNYDIKRYGFYIPDNNYSGNTDETFEKSTIYYNNIDENSDTIKALKLFFDGDFIKTETPKYSKDYANIEIIIGKDYLDKKNNNIFNF